MSKQDGSEEDKRRRAKYTLEAARRVTTDSKHPLAVAENLRARNFTPESPDRVWSSDITDIATNEGWLYSAAVA
jgi:transposase InsO family protein